ncbi:MAG TPA: hypothetical protein VEY30_00335 [Myxococcaceae bacterium]|nr:hypothetical protein [Myxococcaceae bacterium]
MADARRPLRGALGRGGGAAPETPGLEAKMLFELLRETYPGLYELGQLPTLQRRIRR